MFLDRGAPIGVAEASPPAPGEPLRLASEQDAWRDLYTSEEECAARARGIQVIHVDHATYLERVYPLVRSRATTDGSALDEAQREWLRLAAMPLAARVTLIADRAWQRAYLAAYPSAYTATAVHVAAAATDAAATTPGAWLTLQPLAVAAGDAITRLNPAEQDAPPADRHTVAAALTVAQAAIDAGRQPVLEVVEIARRAGGTAGALAGTLAAATDVLIGWRARGGHAVAGELAIDGRPARVWVADLLAGTTRDITAAHLPPRATAEGRRFIASQPARREQRPGTAAATSPRQAAPRAALTAAQLANQDQAPGAATGPTRGGGTSRARPSTSPTTSRTRRQR